MQIFFMASGDVDNLRTVGLKLCCHFDSVFRADQKILSILFVLLDNLNDKN